MRSCVLTPTLENAPDSCEHHIGLKQLAGFIHQPWKMRQTSCEHHLGLKQLAGLMHQPWKMYQTSCEYHLGLKQLAGLMQHWKMYQI